ncbi:outer membrane beta-barrel protein [Nioella sp.]|uniref:outer membrane beta-barrel protein n=1 Tax=Nioella sp. TaxID=1912091 RepID=UPI003A853AFE
MGGELSYVTDSDHQIAPGVDFTIEGPTELRARLGYVTGNTMIYGALGYTWADYTQTGVGFSDSFEGVSYGLGLETLLTESVSLRIDYTHTQYETGDSSIPPCSSSRRIPFRSASHITSDTGFPSNRRAGAAMPRPFSLACILRRFQRQLAGQFPLERPAR